MRTTEIPAPSHGASAAASVGRSVYDQTVRRVVERFTYPAERPVITLMLYYILLLGAGWLVVLYVPGAEELISGRRLAQLGQAKGLADPAPTPYFVWNISISMALAMLGSFLLMLPASWVYMATRRKKGFDQSVVQTFIVLSVAVAGVVIIARNSVALAFSLAGVVGMVRFRNTLPEMRDSLYVFLAIGVGLAAGVEALTAAAVLSMVFNFIVLGLHRFDYGLSELGSDPRRLLVGGPADPDSRREKDREKGFNAVLLVRAHHADKARPVVESILETEVRRFRLAEVETTSKGKGVLKYLVRLGKRVQPAHLEDALIAHGSPNIIGARIH
jgi:hypothetical protein